MIFLSRQETLMYHPHIVKSCALIGLYVFLLLICYFFTYLIRPQHKL